MPANSDDLPRAAWTAKYLASGLAAIAVFLTALFCLPALSYLSLAMFGFPANIVILGGYVGWLLLRPVSRMLADMCGVAFVIAVVLVLVAIVLAAPGVALMILLPSGILYIILRILSNRSTRRRQQAAS